MASLEAHKLRVEMSKQSRWYPAAPHVQTLRIVRDWLFAVMALLQLTQWVVDLFNWFSGASWHWIASLMGVFPSWVNPTLWAVNQYIAALWLGSCALVWVWRILRWNWVDDSITIDACEASVKYRRMPATFTGGDWYVIRPNDQPTPPPPSHWV